MNFSSLADGELVTRSGTGDEQAYAELVRRHQSLVCSVAFSHCGSLSVSEEVAQEAFLKAWQKLSELESPNHFKGWICTIARHLAQRVRRKEVRVGVGNGDALHEVVYQEETPEERAILREEEEMIWRAIAAIPEQYREPLVLYYREGMSVLGASSALGISEDAMKQRLARGRAMLAEQLVQVVAESLAKSKPGVEFTASVMMVIGGKGTLVATGAMSASQGVATVGSSMAWPAVHLPLLAWLFKTAYGEMRSSREREVFRRGMIGIHVGLLLFVVIAAACVWWLPQVKERWIQVWAIPGLMAIFQVGNVLWCRRLGQQIEEIRREEGTAEEPRVLVSSEADGAGYGVRVLAYFGLSAALLLVWGVLPCAWMGDGLGVGMILVSAVVIWLVLASLAMVVERLSFAWYVTSNTLMVLVCLGAPFVTGSVWRNGLRHEWVFWGSLQLMVISLVVLNVLAWKRVYGRR